MPHLTLPIHANVGPVVSIRIGVSAPFEDLLRKQGLPVPSPITAIMLVDTGASSTCVDVSTLAALNLSPTGSTAIHTPSTQQGQAHTCPMYDVSLALPLNNGEQLVNAVPVVGCNFAHQGHHGLIGRDILRLGSLVYNGVSQIFCLAF